MWPKTLCDEQIDKYIYCKQMELNRFNYSTMPAFSIVFVNDSSSL